MAGTRTYMHKYMRGGGAMRWVVGGRPSGRQAWKGHDFRLAGAEQTLTVHHLDDAAVAGQALGQLVAAGDHIAVVRAVRLGLISLVSSAGRVDVVPPGVVGVDGTGVGFVGW